MTNENTEDDVDNSEAIVSNNSTSNDTYVDEDDDSNVVSEDEKIDVEELDISSNTDATINN